MLHFHKLKYTCIQFIQSSTVYKYDHWSNFTACIVHILKHSIIIYLILLGCCHWESYYIVTGMYIVNMVWPWATFIQQYFAIFFQEISSVPNTQLTKSYQFQAYMHSVHFNRNGSQISNHTVAQIDMTVCCVRLWASYRCTRSGVFQ